MARPRLHCKLAFTAVLTTIVGSCGSPASTGTGTANASRSADADASQLAEVVAEAGAANDVSAADAAAADSGPILPQPLAAGVYPVFGSDFDLPGDDLRRLDAALNGVQVVGIGESIHTTGGQIKMRARLLRSLIEQHGLRMVAFEAPRSDVAEKLDPWLQGGPGTAESAVQSLHTIWWDQSTLAFAQWLRQRNAVNPKDPVRAMGFDIRQPWLDAPAFATYIAARDPQGGPKLAADLAPCLGVGYADRKAFFGDKTVLTYYEGAQPTPQPAHDACQTANKAAAAHLVANKQAYVTAAGESAFEAARMAVVAIGAFDATLYWLSRGDLRKANAARDPAMYDLFATQRKLQFPTAKVAVWAANGHILKNTDALDAGQWQAVPSFGHLLGQALGAQYLVVGQTGLEVHYDLPSGKGKRPKPVTSSVEGQLAGLDADFLLVDLKSASLGEQPVLKGATMAVGQDPPMAPAKHYDWLIWHRVSEAAQFFAKPGGGP